MRLNWTSYGRCLSRFGAPGDRREGHSLAMTGFRRTLYKPHMLAESTTEST